MAELGSYVKKFESGEKGPSVVSWDRTGGTSYGTYQFSSLQGGLGDFLDWANRKGGELGAQLFKIMLRYRPWNTGSSSGAPVLQWKQFAQLNNGKDLHKLEYGHMFDRMVEALENKNLIPEIRSLIKSNRALQEAWWSTVVQHGPSGACTVFKQAYAINHKSLKEYLQAIYDVRATKFGSSTAAVRKAVQSRFKEEVVVVTKLLNDEPIKI